MVRKNKTSTRLQKSLMTLAMAPTLVAAAVITLEPNKLLAQVPVLAQTFTIPNTLPTGSTVRVDGSSSMAVANESLKRRFEERFGGSTVTTAANGTDAALQALRQGNIDVAAVGRTLTNEELGQELTKVPLERTKIAIIVGPQNPFNGDLTAEQFAQIFRGEITDWSEVGGAPGPIRFIDRPESSDTRQAFRNYPVFQAGDFRTGATAAPVNTDDTAAVITALGNDGIGYAIADQVIDRSDVRILSLHQTLPDDPRYPFSQPRAYVFRGTPNPQLLAFLGLATTAPGQETVQAAPQTAATPAPATPAAVATPTPAAPATPAAVATPTPAAPATPVAPAAQTEGRGGFPWWWLLLPLLGIPLLAWLFRGKEAAAPAAVAVAEVPRGRLILTPRNCRNAYAYWEVPQEQFEDLRRQGGRDLKLRVYDVTDVANFERQKPQAFKEFDCNPGDPDLHVPIALDNRDYIAELGYKTADGRWMSVAQSASVRVPACTPAEQISSAARAAVVPRAATTVAAGVGAAAAAQAMTSRETTVEPGRIILVPRTTQNAYAYWEVSDALKAETRRQGGRDLKLRIYDATNIDLDKQVAHSVQEYDVSELDQDRHVPIPAGDRDYVAEIGYVTPEGRWLSLARSEHIRVPSDLPPVGPKGPTIGDYSSAASGPIIGTYPNPTIDRSEQSPGILNDLSQTSGPRIQDSTTGVSNALTDVARNTTDAVGRASGTATNVLNSATDTAGEMLSSTRNAAANLADNATGAMGAAIATGTAALGGLGTAAQNLVNQGRNLVDGTQAEATPADCSVRLIPRGNKTASVVWNVADRYREAVRQKGGRKLMLRIHDATGLNLDHDTPHSTQTYMCSESESERVVTVLTGDRDYVAELGYMSDDSRWLLLTRSPYATIRNA